MSTTSLTSPPLTAELYKALQSSNGRHQAPRALNTPASQRDKGVCPQRLPRTTSRPFFHPTHAMLTHTEEGGIKRHLLWTSRNDRKHRHIAQSPKTQRGRRGITFLQKLSHLGRLETWNISWWVAVAFTLGSIVWVVNGFASFLPFCNSAFEKAPNSTGWTAFLGATIFEFGSIFGMWEAWNRSDTTNFGWGVVSTLKNSASTLRMSGEVTGNARGSKVTMTRGEKEVPEHPPATSEKEVPGPSPAPSSPASYPNGSESAELSGLSVNASKSRLNDIEMAVENPQTGQRWIWFSLDPKYFYELGFLAAFFQLMGASIFWIAGLTAIPQIQDAIAKHIGVLDGVFWTPQVVGGSGFIISSTFIMLESQEKWYIPKPLSLGWQVGVWNFIGGVGFTLCGALGYASSSTKAEYQSSLSTFWGGWAFLIGSVIQWYESVNSV